MLGIEKVDYIGICATDKAVSIAFYERPGFRTLFGAGIQRGHPVTMQAAGPRHGAGGSQPCCVVRMPCVTPERG